MNKEYGCIENYSYTEEYGSQMCNNVAYQFIGNNLIDVFGQMIVSIKYSNEPIFIHLIMKYKNKIEGKKIKIQTFSPQLS